jgi:thiol:disulfide interchange protein DsbD
VIQNFRINSLLFSLLLLIAIPGASQIPDPVSWTATVEKANGSDEAVLVMRATIEKGCHLYSQLIPDGGPIKTTFNFQQTSNYILDGSPEESKATEFYDKNFEMHLKYFSGVAEFRQKIKLAIKGNFSIAGNVEYMVCDDEKCLPPKTVDLAFDIK